jgi:hypothetical protein
MTLLLLPVAPLSITIQTSPCPPFSRHEGPVWQVAWAHPKFGNLLASASYDNKVQHKKNPAPSLLLRVLRPSSPPPLLHHVPQVIIWKETPAGWENVYEHKAHQGSGECVKAVAPSPAVLRAFLFFSF